MTAEKLTWTKDKPMVAGFYWIKVRGEQAAVFRVSPWFSDRRTEGTEGTEGTQLFVETPDAMLPVTDFKDSVHWAGPISEPGEATETAEPKSSKKDLPAVHQFKFGRDIPGARISAVPAKKGFTFDAQYDKETIPEVADEMRRICNVLYRCRRAGAEASFANGEVRVSCPRELSAAIKGIFEAEVPQ